MAFSNTVVDKIEVGPGLIMEYGTFNAASVPTGTIQANTATTYSYPGAIVKVLQWGFASDSDIAVIPARDQDDDKIKITCTTSDTGDYWITGFGA